MTAAIIQLHPGRRGALAGPLGTALPAPGRPVAGPGADAELLDLGARLQAVLGRIAAIDAGHIACGEREMARLLANRNGLVDVLADIPAATVPGACLKAGIAVSILSATLADAVCLSLLNMEFIASAIEDMLEQIGAKKPA